MDFKDYLNGYIDVIGCTAKELCAVTGLSAPTISRYRTGERVPILGSHQLEDLSRGIAELSQTLPVERRLDAESVYESLTKSISGLVGEYSLFLQNLNLLLATLKISNATVAQIMDFDPSYISRILAGKRHPADTQRLITTIARHVARYYSNTDKVDELGAIMHTDPDLIRNENMCALAIMQWLNSDATPQHESVERLVATIDVFDVAEYARSLRLGAVDELDREFDFPEITSYKGIEGLKRAALDFLDATVLSGSKGTIYMYSDMPLYLFANDIAFGKSWAQSMVRLLQTGSNIVVVHDTNRSVSEIVSGFDRWLPMYMTGQVSPYYLEQPQVSVFQHMMQVSDGAVLSGMSIEGSQTDTLFTVSTSPARIAQYKQLVENLVKRARPLVRIFSARDFEQTQPIIKSAISNPSKWRLIWSSLPLFTIDNEMLEQMLDRAGISDEDRSSILSYAESTHVLSNELFRRNEVTIEIPDLTANELTANPLKLSLSGMYYNKPIYYTYDEYRRHFDATIETLSNIPTCTIKRNSSPTYRDVLISIKLGSYVVISKQLSPSMHFVIDHPDIIPLFEKLIVPVSQ